LPISTSPVFPLPGDPHTRIFPLVLASTVDANCFRGDNRTVWTLFNAAYRTFRGDCLRVPHNPGAVYIDAFSGKPVAHGIEKGYAVLAVVLAPRGVGCVVEIRKRFSRKAGRRFCFEERKN
jgi:hypothetical protein